MHGRGMLAWKPALCTAHDDMCNLSTLVPNTMLVQFPHPCLAALNAVRFEQPKAAQKPSGRSLYQPACGRVCVESRFNLRYVVQKRSAHFLEQLSSGTSLLLSASRPPAGAKGKDVGGARGRADHKDGPGQIRGRSRGRRQGAQRAPAQRRGAAARGPLPWRWALRTWWLRAPGCAATCLFWTRWGHGFLAYHCHQLLRMSSPASAACLSSQLQLYGLYDKEALLHLDGSRHICGFRCCNSWMRRAVLGWPRCCEACPSPTS